MPGNEETIKVNGKAIQLFTGGGGTPLLYLHGAGTYWWMPVHDLLAARHRVYLPVHPGFGASQGFEEIESMEDLVFHAVDVLDALGLEPYLDLGMRLGEGTGAALAFHLIDASAHILNEMATFAEAGVIEKE